jgi:hypothetical protein
MKKSIFLLLLISSTQLFALDANNLALIIQKAVSNEEEFVKFVSKNERKSFYDIQVSQIKSDAERASFMEGLFASSKIVVVSRPDENGTLKVTALNQFTIEQVKQEVEAILVASKSKPSKNVQKNK